MALGHLLGGTDGVRLGRAGRPRLPGGGGWKVWWMIGLRFGFGGYERWEGDELVMRL